MLSAQNTSRYIGIITIETRKINQLSNRRQSVADCGKGVPF